MTHRFEPPRSGEELLWALPADAPQESTQLRRSTAGRRALPKPPDRTILWLLLGIGAFVFLGGLALVTVVGVWLAVNWTTLSGSNVAWNDPDVQAIEHVDAQLAPPQMPEDLQPWLAPDADLPERLRPFVRPEFVQPPDPSPEPPRPKEPELLVPQGVRELATFKAHEKDIVGLAVSPDGRTLATGTGRPPLFLEDTGEIKFWDTQTRKETARFTGSGPLDFTPDGKFLFYFPNRNVLEFAAAAVNAPDDHVQNTMMRRREVATRDQQIGGPRATAMSRWHNNFSFAPDGLSVLTISQNTVGSSLRLTDLKTLKELEVWPVKDGNVSGVAFAPDSRSFAMLLGGSADVRICDGATGETRRTCRGHEGEVHSLSYSRDGRRLATAGSDRTVRVWSPETGDAIARFEGHTDAVLQVAFAPDANLLASVSADGTLRLWDVNGARPLGGVKLPAEGDNFSAHVTFASAGGSLIGSRGGSIRLWDTRAVLGAIVQPPNLPRAQVPDRPAPKPPVVDPPKPPVVDPEPLPVKEENLVRSKWSKDVGINNYLHAVTFTPDGKDVITVGDGGRVRRWRAATGEELPGALDAHPRASVLTVSLSGDGKTVATGSIDGTAKVWELETGRLIATAGRLKGTFMHAALSPDGKLLATASNEVNLFDVAGNKHLAALPVPRGFLDAIAFSPDGKYLAAGHKNGATVWDTATQRETAALGGHKGPVMSVAFSPDGATLATASSDGTIKLWDHVKQVEQRTLTGHADPLSSVAFSPDGKLLVSGAGVIRFNPGRRGEVKLWDPVTGKFLADLKDHTNGVSSVAFSSDGRTVASGGKDNKLKAWDVSAFAGKPAVAKPAPAPVPMPPPPEPKPIDVPRVEPARPDGDSAALAGQAHEILRKHCHRCHGLDGTAEGGFNFVLQPSRMLARKFLVPSRPTDSRLLQRVRRAEMPPPEEKDDLDDRQIAVLNRWVAAGAPDFNPPRAKRSLTTPLDTVQVIRDDLAKREGPDRHSSRYLTFTHLHNAGLSDDELQTHRHALSKLVNSLTRSPGIVVPQPIDAERLVYRVNLRDYGWDTKLWEEMIKAYPYRVEHAHEAADFSRTATRSEQPSLRGDWFTATASRPPFYYKFLQMPDTWLELTTEQHIGWDASDKLPVTLPHRAGFLESGGARNNRVLERWITRHGAFWQTFDFATNKGKQNVLAHPIDFEHDASEVFFSLPNGLQAYAIFDAKGARKDKGSTDVVSDPRRPDRAVEAGLSCMNCHTRGIIEKADQVRGHVEKNRGAFYGQPKLILEQYPPTTEFDLLLRKDSKRFHDAVKKTGAPLNRTEPIVAVTQRYEADVDLALAAAEVGTTPAELVKLCRGSRDLPRLLGPLFDGGTIKREVFVEVFPRLVGTPK